MNDAENEIMPGVGPAASMRSLKDDVAYDVKRVILRNSILRVVGFWGRLAGFAAKIALAALCLFLMWRGAKTLFVPQSAAPVAAETAETASAAASATAAAATSSSVSAALVLAMILVILLLPVVTISFIRTMVSKRSNGVNAFTLGVYVSIDMILAFFMVGASLETTAEAVLFAGAAVFSLVYDLTVMNYALRLEDGA